MASPRTTHVLEIETGIGEPAFIPLSAGHELQPISVGKKGMWRIESPRVLDVHAFVYFDGTSLFLQSADEHHAATVDGYPVGKSWTELHAPCKIEVGAARLRYRSLIADPDNQPTMFSSAHPMAPRGGAGRPNAGASMPVAGAPEPPTSRGATQLSPQPSSGSGSGSGRRSSALSFPKAERPFKPSEFSARSDDGDSTRVGPVDTAGASRLGPSSAPRPAAGQPADREPRAEAARAIGVGSGKLPVLSTMPFEPVGRPPGMPHDAMLGAVAHGGAIQTGGPLQAGSHPPQGYGQQPQPQQGFTGAAPDAYGSATPRAPLRQPERPQNLIAKLKPNSLPKVIAGLLFIISGILYLADDDEPVVPRKKAVATRDSGGAPAVDGGGAPAVTGIVTDAGNAQSAETRLTPPVMPQGSVFPAWPPGVACPPPNWPPNTPLPCTPNALGTTPEKNPPDKGSKDATKPHDSKDAGAPPLPAGTKTLERQAVDFVSSGDNAKAAVAYEELARRDPNRKVYAEAARILRAKLDGGGPGP